MALSSDGVDEEDGEAPPLPGVGEPKTDGDELGEGDSVGDGDDSGVGDALVSGVGCGLGFGGGTEVGCTLTTVGLLFAVELPALSDRLTWTKAL